MLAAALFVAFAGPAWAGHWYANGWRDRHANYPAKPNGLTAINNVFGGACNGEANDNSISWYAADDDTVYNVVFHRKLGAAAASSNVEDVRGLIGNNHWDNFVKSGIWGYNCRYISGTTKWSTHAWGIAADQNASYEHLHSHTHTIDNNVKNVWESHGWTWGLSFNDPMHFQYASGY